MQEPLVLLLREGSGEAKEYALWSLSLAIDETFFDVVTDKGGTHIQQARTQPNHGQGGCF